MLSRFKRNSVSAFVVSCVVHSVALGSMALVVQQVQRLEPSMMPIETMFDEERTQEQFEQQIETTTAAATSMSYVSGGTVTGFIGGGGAGGGGGGGTGLGAGTGITQGAIQGSESLKSMDVSVNIGVSEVGGIGDLGTDLGEGAISGEVGAAVEGYGTALGRVTQEIVRQMRQSKVMVVWLFDESESMKDDQQEIRDQFHKVYEELGIVEKQDKDVKAMAARDKEILQTVICGYGEKVHELMKAPSSDLKEIRKAIDKIGIDGSGIENTCQAVSMIVDKYGPLVRRQKRKLLVVLVTDESGNDGSNIDATIDKVKRYETPVYIMGREAVFGYPLAHINWKDPKYGLWHQLPINRGPETPFPEAIQFDGLHARWDSYSSGFGPYEQSRLAKESGGIFFILPGEEEQLIGQDAIEKRKFQFLDMKEYTPSMVSRREYLEERKKSKFREGIAEVIASLDPAVDKELNVREHHYPAKKDEFQKEGKANFDRGMHAMAKLYEAHKLLEKIAPLRAAEESTRWRANFDLLHAQVLGYRVRLFQAMLALDKHARVGFQPKDKKYNEWHLLRTAQMLAPDPQVVKVTKIDMAELKKQEQTARKLFEQVIKDHPQTPWARRAEWELGNGFGFTMIENWRDPRYYEFDQDVNMKRIKLPTP